MPEKVAGDIFRGQGKQLSSISKNENNNSLKRMQLTLRSFQKHVHSRVPQDSLHALHWEACGRDSAVCWLVHLLFLLVQKNRTSQAVFFSSTGGRPAAAGAAALFLAIPEKLRRSCEHSTPTLTGGGKQPLASVQSRGWAQIGARGVEESRCQPHRWFGRARRE